MRNGDAWLGVRSSSYRLGRRAILSNPSVQGLLIQSGMAEAPGEWMSWRKEPTPELEKAWELTEALLVRLRDEVEADGSRFALFYVPSRPAIYPADRETTRRAYAMDDNWNPSQDAVSLAVLCERQRIACIIALDEFRVMAKELQASQQALYFQNDAHWTPQGHRLASQLIADYVLAEIKQDRSTRDAGAANLAGLIPKTAP